MDALKTNNEAWGFFGTISETNIKLADQAWNEAMNQVAAETGHDKEDIRTWLDSRSGRHFADDVINHLNGSTITSAIEKAITQWSAWKATKQHRKDGAPASATYLMADIASAQHSAPFQA